MNEKDIQKFKESAMIGNNVHKINYTNLNEFYKMLDTLECTNEDRAMFILSRYGIKPSNINLIQWSNINRTGMVIEFNDIQLPIDVRFLNIIDKLNRGSDTIFSCTIEKIYTRISIVSRNNNIPRISLQELVKNRAFDLLIKKYNINNKLLQDDFKEVTSQIYGENKINIVHSLMKSFENTMDIKVS